MQSLFNKFMVGINHLYSPQNNLLALELVNPEKDFLQAIELIKDRIRDELGWILTGRQPSPMPQITCRIKNQKDLLFAISPQEIAKELSNLDQLIDQATKDILP